MRSIGRTAAKWVFQVSAFASIGLVADATPAKELTPSMSIRLQLTEHALDTPQSVAATYTRIRNAARSVCGYADHVFREEQDAWNDCVAATIRHTVAQIGNAQLADHCLTRSHTSNRQSKSRSPIRISKMTLKINNQRDFRSCADPDSWYSDAVCEELRAT